MNPSLNPTVPTTPAAPQTPTGVIAPVTQAQSSYTSGQALPQVGSPEYEKAQQMAQASIPKQSLPTSPNITPIQPTQPNSLSSQADDITAQRAQIDESYQQALSKMNSTLEGIRTGTVPLSPYEQAQVEGTRSAFQSLIEEQKLANKNYEGGVTVANEARGLSRYSPQIAQGEILAAVTEGNKKIANLNAQMGQNLAQMETAFRDNDFNKVKDAFQYITAAKEEKTHALDTMYNTVVAKQQAMQKQQQENTLAGLNGLLEDDSYSFNDKKAYISKVIASGQLTPDQIKEVRSSLKDAQAVQAKSDEGFQSIMKTISENKALTPAQRKAGVKEINDIMARGGNLNEAYYASSDYLGELGIGGNELLTINEAKDLGLPYGTTRNEAIKLNRVPGAGSVDPKTGLPVNPEVAKGNAADYQTINSAYSRLNGTLSSTGFTAKQITDLAKTDYRKAKKIVDGLSSQEAEALAREALRIQTPDIAKTGTDAQASLRQSSELAWAARWTLSQIGLMKQYDPDQVLKLLQTVENIKEDTEKNLMPGSVGAENITIAPDGEQIEIID